VFADAARALGNLALGEAPPVAWLYKVAQRRLVDRARSLERRRREVSGDLALESVRSPQPEYGAEAGEALRAAIEQLPREQRRVIVMKLVQGCSFAEIARQVEASEGACRMRFLRGLEQLRALLEQEEVTP
jgi:RNA polymerase sigma-70 factor (ECF subfamily)